MPVAKLNELLKGYVKNIFPSLKKKFGNRKLPKLAPKKVINRKRFIISISVLALFIIASAYIYFSGIAYTVKVDGTEIGKVKNVQLVFVAQKKLEEIYHNTAQGNIKLTANITTEKSRARKKEILNETQLLDAFKSNINFTVQTYSLYVNGNQIAIFKSKAEADDILNSVKSNYLDGIDQSQLKEVSFAEDVSVKEEYNDISKITNKDEILPFIIKGTDEVKTHEVESGESFWSISRKYNMSVDELVKANPNINPNRLQIGQEINMIVPKPIISVKTVETITYTDKIQFDQTLEYSDSMYKDQTSIRVKGEYGEKEVVADVVKINGMESERNIISEKVTKQPKTQILVKGTKALPPKKGTGTFAMPTRGRLTSNFGRRWGRMHEGIDLAAPVGTTVKAADGGVVIWVGTLSGYGKLIKVDHGAGYVSYYGHLSKYSVKVGDKVYKGQKIGEVGNTGNSTGPHVHFEIRKNGTPVNPLKYLK